FNKFFRSIAMKLNLYPVIPYRLSQDTLLQLLAVCPYAETEKFPYRETFSENTLWRRKQGLPFLLALFKTDFIV
ncbi:MAG: hypothetical protein Q8L07_13215, partial [Sediminibacterium sp.]|nr:hypothetical protein [Sediminibacterium sp.]